MVNIRLISSTQESAIEGLCHLLIDVVNGGASVGFLAPLSTKTALNYWQDLFSKQLNNGLLLWIAELEGKIIGSVQLQLCNKENARHRAEIQKLFVLSNHRGKGVSSKLMQAAESFAYSNGRTLLVLDTESGSVAESIYKHLGWQKVGEIPDYAASPDGKLHATSYFFKCKPL
ncbi:MAG: GNAT family N-acetyltransferase [Blastocatellia bacterium]|nr:GNAT family N-acetyltransferase [Blastocatellia bacterium]